MNVLVLIGSLRRESDNRRLAAAALDHLAAGVTATVWDRLAELPHYSEDLDGPEAPGPATDLRAAVEDADALLVVTPEYNGSLPGSLKNAIDWLSRPRGSAVIAGKRTAVLAATRSPRGAQWARDDAVRILGVAGADVLDPTIGIAHAHEAFADGRLVDPDVDAALRELVAALSRQERAAA